MHLCFTHNKIFVCCGLHNVCDDYDALQMHRKIIKRLDQVYKVKEFFCSVRQAKVKIDFVIFIYVCIIILGFQTAN